MTDPETGEIYIDLETVVAYVRKPCTCTRSPLAAAGFLAHEQTCPIFHAIDPRVKLAWFLVTRTGTSRSEGGEGVCWACTCGDGDEDRPTCKHVNDLFASNVKELDNAALAQDHVHDSFRGSVILLTPYGGSILHAVWAANALRENPAGVQAQGIPSGGTGYIPSGANQQPIQIYRGPGASPNPWSTPPGAASPWATSPTPRRRWWHSVWPFNKR